MEGERVFLRAFEPGDERVLAKIENHPESRITLFYAMPTSPQQQFDKIQKQIDNPNSIVLIVCDKKSGAAIGQTAFFHIDWVGRMATFYIGIADKEYRGKGLGTEIVGLMLDYAFGTLNLHRVQLHVATKNIAGIKAYKRNGFIIEGLLREAMYGNGEYHDFHLMAILKKDYKKHKNLKR